MPLHEYLTANGRVVEVLHGTEPTKVPDSWKRIISAVSFSTGSVKEQGMSEKVKAGFYRNECESGSRFRSKYSKKQIKTAWGW